METRDSGDQRQWRLETVETVETRDSGDWRQWRLETVETLETRDSGDSGDRDSGD